MASVIGILAIGGSVLGFFLVAFIIYVMFFDSPRSSNLDTIMMPKYRIIQIKNQYMIEMAYFFKWEYLGIRDTKEKALERILEHKQICQEKLDSIKEEREEKKKRKVIQFDKLTKQYYNLK